MKRRLEKAEDFIESRGYRRCDIMACNCGSWHGGHLSARLDEIRELLSEKDIPWQGTILATVEYALRSSEMPLSRKSRKSSVEQL